MNYSLKILFLILILPILINGCTKSSPVKNETQHSWYEEVYHHERMDEALQEAKKRQKKLMIVLTADWCPPCQVFKKEVLETEKFEKLKESFIFLVKDVDIDGVWGIRNFYTANIPTFIIVDFNQIEIGRITDYKNYGKFERGLSLTLSGKSNELFEKEIENNPSIEAYEHYVYYLTGSNQLQKIEELKSRIRNGKWTDKEKNSLMATIYWSISNSHQSADPPRWKEAYEAFKVYKKFSTFSSSYLDAVNASLLFHNGKKEEAAKFIEESATKYKKSGEKLKALLSFYRRTNQTDLYEREITKLQKKSKKNLIEMETLADGLRFLGKRQLALDLYKELSIKKPDDSDIRSSIIELQKWKI